MKLWIPLFVGIAIAVSIVAISRATSSRYRSLCASYAAAVREEWSVEDGGCTFTVKGEKVSATKYHVVR